MICVFNLKSICLRISFATICIILLTNISSNAQLLYPESYVIIFDTTRTYKGTIAPSVEIKTPKELYVEINNRANIAYRLKNHGIIVANNFELTKNGSQTILSGGYLYFKFKIFYDNPIVLEHYAQYQWADARGMSQKYAAGSNLRYKIYKNLNGGAFAGIGPFYEYEQWNYTAVPTDKLPEVLSIVETHLFKLNAYVSIRQTLTDKVKAEFAFYYQDPFEDLFKNPRIGGSLGISYSFTSTVAFAVQYRMLYDFKPVVPVDNLWYNAFTELQVTF